jgi:hypothetical protein
VILPLIDPSRTLSTASAIGADELVGRLQGSGDVLECHATDDRVENPVGTRRRRGVAPAEIDVDCAYLALSTASRTDVVAALPRARGQRI